MSVFEDSLCQDVALYLDVTAGSIRAINIVGGTKNCVNCSVATDATLAGHRASALIRSSGVVHVFNAVNQKGAVRFLDGQTGYAAALDGYIHFRFLRTN